MAPLGALDALPPPQPPCPLPAPHPGPLSPALETQALTRDTRPNPYAQGLQGASEPAETCLRALPPPRPAWPARCPAQPPTCCAPSP